MDDEYESLFFAFDTCFNFNSMFLCGSRISPSLMSRAPLSCLVQTWILNFNLYEDCKGSRLTAVGQQQEGTPAVATVLQSLLLAKSEAIL